MKDLLIIGGSDAGISAALRAREIDPDWHVRLIVADRFPNYSLCGLPFYLSGETPRWESLAHRTRSEIEGHGVELLLETVAQRIDPTGHRVHVGGPTGAVRELPYDRLIIATGAVPAKPSIRGLEKPSVHVLHSMADSFAVDKHLASRSPTSAIIVGAGYIGMEMADALRHRGLNVTVFDIGTTVLQTVDPGFGRLVQAELERHGVKVRIGAPIETIEHVGQELKVRDREGARARADLVLVATGVRPSVDLARTAGLALGERGALRVNRAMESNVPDVYAGGDCVETHHWSRLRPTCPSGLPPTSKVEWPARTWSGAARSSRAASEPRSSRCSTSSSEGRGSATTTRAATASILAPSTRRRGIIRHTIPAQRSSAFASRAIVGRAACSARRSSGLMARRSRSVWTCSRRPSSTACGSTPWSNSISATRRLSAAHGIRCKRAA